MITGCPADPGACDRMRAEKAEGKDGNPAHSIASAWVGRAAGDHRAQASSLYLLAYYIGSSAARPTQALAIECAPKKPKVKTAIPAILSASWGKSGNVQLGLYGEKSRSFRKREND
jgi:hypothetical protein